MTRVYEWAKSYQSGRSDRAKLMDERRQAKTVFGKDLGTKEYRLWKKSPGRYDIDGIDTPESTGEVTEETKVVEDARIPPTKNVDSVSTPTAVKREPDDFDKPKKRQYKKRPKTNKMEYSASWYERLPWKTDPERAARMAMEAMNIENVEDTTEMRAYLGDVAYDEIDDDYDRDDRSVARAYHNKMWQDYHAQELYDAGMYSEKSDGDGEQTEKKKRKRLTKTQKRDLRDMTALGISSAGLGLSIASLALSLSPKSRDEFYAIVQEVYDHMRFVDPKGLKSEYGRTEDRAKEAIGRQLMDPQGSETLAKSIVSKGGKGSRTLAKRIRDWNQNR